MSETSQKLYNDLLQEIRKVLIGHDGAVRLAATAMLAGGHILLEGPPGIGKTLLARTLSKALDLKYKRIQFTPDLMPSDIIGTNIYDIAASRFNFQPGPIFTDLLLADEINRSPAKTQAALLEVMQEKQVTVDGKTSKVSDVFTVVATQNPIELEGTHPLPEAQLDRFMFKVVMGYPEEKDEVSVINTHHAHFQAGTLDDFGVNKVLDLKRLSALRSETEKGFIKPEVAAYAVKLVRKTREDPNIEWGASSRAALTLFVAAKSWAAIDGRDYVIPDDIQQVMLPVLRHRIILKPGSMLEGVTEDDILSQIMNTVEVPK